MSKIQKRIKLTAIFTVFLSNIILPAFAMDAADDTFRIKFARQEVYVRTSEGDDTYAWSTWEDAIKKQGLAEKSVAEKINIDEDDVDGMCSSHAVVCALEYCHQRSDLLASYLVKAVSGRYDKGMNTAEGMEFAKTNGVMALPPGQTVEHGSGKPWPSGPRYKFKYVFDPYLIHNLEMNGVSMLEYVNADDWDAWGFYLYGPTPKNQSSKVFKYILKKYNHPIVVSVHCGYKGREELSPFLRLRGKINDKDAPEKNNEYRRPGPLDFPLKKTFHAIVIYGYKESTKRFLVKNSWGPEDENGLCTLPYGYFNRYTRNAWVGFGRESWEGDGIYGDVRGPKLVEQHMCSRGQGWHQSSTETEVRGEEVPVGLEQLMETARSNFEKWYDGLLTFDMPWAAESKEGEDPFSSSGPLAFEKWRESLPAIDKPWATELLKECTSKDIEHLILSSNYLDGAEMLRVVVRGNFLKLNFLHLSFVTEGMATLFRANFPNLKSVYLVSCELGVEGVNALACNNMPKLTNLDFKDCKLGNKSGNVLARGNFQNLWVLNLQACGLDDEDGKALACGDFPKLELLYLVACNFSDPKEILRAFSRGSLPKLKSLNIWHDNVSTAGFSYVPEAEEGKRIYYSDGTDGLTYVPEAEEGKSSVGNGEVCNLQ